MDLAPWESAFASAVSEFPARLVTYLPSLAAGLGLVLAGWVAASVSALVVSRLIGGGVRLLARHPRLGSAVERSGLRLGFVKIFSRVVFWFVLALFVAAAVERLDLTIAASLVSVFAAFLPRLLVGIVIVFAGIVAGQMAYVAVNQAAMAAGLPQAGLLARSVQTILIFFGIVTGADQLGIQSTLLTVVVATAMGAVLGGATLAFGLGSRVAVGNIVAMFYLLKTYHVGQLVRIGQVEGEIVEMTQTGVFIASAEGRVLVPGRLFSEEVSTLLTGGRS